MKRIALLLALTVMLSFTAVAQQSSAAGAPDKKTAKAEKKEAKASEKGKAMRLTGWVKTEGDKVVFVNDKDKQTWTVSNPDVLKPHDGHHVRVKATPNVADKTLTVDSVKELRKGKQAAETQKKG